MCAALFFAVDLVWLSVATRRFYQPYAGALLSDQSKLGVAAAFYLAYVVGVVALFGFLAYATYDLTNLATLRGWAWQVTAIDLVWGTTVTSVVAVAGYYAGRWLGIG
ncbi:MAG: DUF2177 family protein [Coriobacteriia bacterium]